jgi:hypothetical protein
MTMIVWAACDNFALMIADRQVHCGKATLDLSGLTLGDDITKAKLSKDGMDIFAVAGINSIKWLDDVVTSAQRSGPDADRWLLPNAENFLTTALDPESLPHPSTVLHSYRMNGKIICCKTDWSSTQSSRLVIIAKSDKVTVTAAGSGAPYVQSLAPVDGELWTSMEKRIDDWRPVQAYFFRPFRAVTILAKGVGPDIDTWLLAKDEQAWRQLERVNVSS